MKRSTFARVSPLTPERAGQSSGPEDRAATPASRSARRWRPFAQYIDRDGRARELVTALASSGSLLVVDRGRGGQDHRLLAHLGADEPFENAALVAADYLHRAGEARCRKLCQADLLADPLERDPPAGAEPSAGPPRDRAGRSYRIEPVTGRASIQDLRWCSRHDAAESPGEVVSLRAAVARLERYEPLCSLTEHALSVHGEDGAVSTTILRAELQRVRESPIVLNRRLREIVLGSVRAGASMSEIAIRCGRVKHDARGNQSGETSWLARRLGILAEGGQSLPTPWIHTDVLALIARRGLGLSPREVETP
jgi:hypothetical protein